MSEKIIVSSLPKTWILDLDGTIVKHNGYKLDGRDTLLPGIELFLNKIQPNDVVIFVTSRKEDVMGQTEEFLREAGIRYDHIIYNAPYGERILVNDAKPSGLKTAIAINTSRNESCNVDFITDESL